MTERIRSYLQLDGTLADLQNDTVYWNATNERADLASGKPGRGVDLNGVFQPEDLRAIADHMEQQRKVAASCSNA